MSGQVLVIPQRFGFCTEIGICHIEIGSYCVETVLYCTEMDIHLVNWSSSVSTKMDESCAEIGYHWSEIILSYAVMGAEVQTPSVVISVAKSHTGVMPGDRCILCRDWCCFIGDGLSHCRDGYNSSLICLPVSQTNEQDNKGQVLTHTIFLSTRPLKTVESYNLDDEDGAIYSDTEDIDHFSSRSEWPDKTLKKMVAQSQAPQSDEPLSLFCRCTTSMWTS